MRDYDGRFYEGRDELTRLAAETILGIVRRTIPEVRAAVDVGCGLGTWLSVLREQGVPEVLGIDGEWVDPGALVIPRERFVTLDLSRHDLPAERTYDLVISLEVAEHLPQSRAVPFVTQLTRLGDFVLFSAAVPGQEGVHHVNEQWPEYWVELFEDRGFDVFDIIRQRTWADERMPVHYRQNVLLFVKRERVPELKLDGQIRDPGPLSIVHPQLFLNKVAHLKNPTVGQSLKLLRGALVKRVKRDLRLRG